MAFLLSLWDVTVLKVLERFPRFMEATADRCCTFPRSMSGFNHSSFRGGSRPPSACFDASVSTPGCIYLAGVLAR